MSICRLTITLSLAAAILLMGCRAKEEPFISPPSSPGDINVNGIAYEVADMVLFSNYFIYGSAVFTVEPAAQIRASDVNEDGTPLTVPDLVFLGRILNGDDVPRFRFWPTVEINFSQDRNGVLHVSDVRIGAAYIVTEGNSTPVLLADNMRMEYAYDGTNTRILVWSREGQSCTGDFLSVSGKIVSIEMATEEGNPVVLKSTIQESFHLNQNYPNPFSSETRIGIVLAERSQISLVITDAAGRLVYTHSQFCEADVTEIIWYGTNNAGDLLDSGVYYCSVTALGITKKIKMNLIR